MLSRFIFRWPRFLKLTIPIVVSALSLSTTDLQAQGVNGHAFIRWAPQDPGTEMLAIALEPGRAASLRDDGAHAVSNLVSANFYFGEETIEQRWLLVQEFLTRTGVEESGNTSLYVKSHSDSLHIDHASVITQSGRVVEIDPATVQVLLEDDGGVYSDDYRIVIPWPNLEPGARYVLGYRIVTDRSRLAAPWSRLVYAQSVSPRERLELGLQWDAGVQRPDLHSDFDELQCDGGHENELRCVAVSVAALNTDYNVNYFDNIPHVLVAEPTTWGEISDLMLGYVSNAWTDDSAVASFTESLIADLDTGRERLEALHSFVSREIRYVGIGTGTNNLIPGDSARTLERRYGDCKDKTALFLHMAHHAGITAYPMLVSTLRTDLDRVQAPAINYFDHMIACGVVDELRFCIDLTDPYSPLGYFSPSLVGAVVLPLDGASVRPSRMPVLPFPWGKNVRSDVTVSGRDVIEVEQREYGPGYVGGMRALLVGMNERDRQDWVRQNYHATVGTDVIPEIRFEGLDDHHSWVRITTTNTFTNVIRPGEPLLYTHMLPWLVDLLIGLRSENRYYDFVLQGVGYRETTQFDLVDWHPLSSGAQVDFDSRFGRMSRESRIDGNKVYVTTELRLPTQTIPLADIGAFNRFINTLIENSTIRIRIAPSTR